MGITSDAMKSATESTKTKKSTDNKEAAKSSKNSRQIVPGVLSLPSEQGKIRNQIKALTQSNLQMFFTASQVQQNVIEEKPEVVAKKPGSQNKSVAGSSKQQQLQQPEKPKESTAPTTVATTSAATCEPTPVPNNHTSSAQETPQTNSTAPESDTTPSIIVNPKQQLLYLAQILDFQVQFSDFPKGNHGEFLTLVTLSTNPPQLLHGSGKTMEESNDQAAMKALGLLRKLGLGIIKKGDGES